MLLRAHPDCKMSFRTYESSLVVVKTKPSSVLSWAHVQESALIQD
jgi:hypothetical protein